MMPRNGLDHSVFLDSKGQVWTVGSGQFGQLGHGNTANEVRIKRVEGLPACTMVTAGFYHTACVTKDGRLFCFGKGENGQLGLGDYNDATSPRCVAGLPPISSVACGQLFTVCLGRDGSVWAFGDDSHGQLGLNTTNDKVCQPTKVNIRASQVACGENHTVLLDPQGHLYACGDNQYGQLSIDGRRHSQFTKVPFEQQIRTVYCTEDSTLIHAKDGSIWTAGYNGDGELGLGDTTNRATFQSVAGMKAVQVACGWRHVMIIDEKAQLYGWGRAAEGQLSGSQTLSPRHLRSDAAVVSTGYKNTFLLTTSGDVVICGYNQCGQLSLGDNTNRTSWAIGSSITSDMIVLPGHWHTVPWSDYQESLSLTPTEEVLLEEMDVAITTHSIGDKSLAPLSLASWKACYATLQQHTSTYQQAISDRRNKHSKQQEEINVLQSEIGDLQAELQAKQAQLTELQASQAMLNHDLSLHQTRVEPLKQLTTQCSRLLKIEEQRDRELAQLLSQSSLHNLEDDQLDLVWWRMDLEDHQSTLKAMEITGEMVGMMNSAQWMEVGLSQQEAARTQFISSMMEREGGLVGLRTLEEQDCVVCNSCTVSSTINLLKERKIPIPEDSIQRGQWTTPLLIYASFTKQDLGIVSNKEYGRVLVQLNTLRKAHEEHLQELEAFYPVFE